MLPLSYHQYNTIIIIFYVKISQTVFKGRLITKFPIKREDQILEKREWRERWYRYIRNLSFLWVETMEETDSTLFNAQSPILPSYSFVYFHVCFLFHLLPYVFLIGPLHVLRTSQKIQIKQTDSRIVRIKQCGI